MAVIKSAVVAIIAVALTALVVLCIIKTLRQRKSGKLQFIHVFVLCLNIIVAFCYLWFFGDYIYPYERTVNPKLYAVFPISEDYQVSAPGDIFWHGAYEVWFPYSESFYLNPEADNKYGAPLSLLDFRHNSYVFTYGQEIEKLTYNVWDTIDYPVKTGAKVGKMELCDTFYPQTMFIYEIPKIRLENDINKTLTNPNGIPAAGNVFWSILFIGLGCIVCMVVSLGVYKERKGQLKTGDGLREP